MRDRIPGSVKDGWFARRGYQPDGFEENLIRELWAAMEGVQAELEAKGDKD